MATSKVYTKTAGEIIEEALRDAQIIPAEQPVNAVDYQNGLNSLNNVSKYWQTKGIHLWLLERAVLPLNVGQKVYEMGPDGDPCGYEDTFYDTTTSAAAVTGATTLTVTTTSGMVAAPDILTSDPTDSTQDWTTGAGATLSISSGLRVTNGAGTAGTATYDLDATAGVTYRVRVSFTLGTSVGAVLSVLNGATVEDSETVTASGDVELTITASQDTIVFKIENSSSTITEYSTIYDLNYVDEDSGSRIGVQQDDDTVFWSYVLTVNSATSVTMSSGLTDDSASGNYVFYFTTQIDRPLRLFNATYADQPGVSEIPVNRWSRQEYVQQPDKSSQGTVVNWYYNPDLELGKLYVWQTASQVGNLLRFDVRKPLSVYSAVGDELDYPSEYFMPLKWAIAADLGPSYGVPQDRQAINEMKAAEHLESSLDNDNELDSIYISPSFN